VNFEFVRKIDPNDDPSAEPISVPARVVLLLATTVSTWMFLRWKIQPTQDFGHHLAMVAVVADYHHPDSLYPAIYKPFDWLSTNSLLYSVAAILGQLISPSLAFRLCMASYVGGMPLVTLWSLRVFGRSAWGAILAVKKFQRDEAYGLEEVLAAAPPRMRMHYVNILPQSRYFTQNSFWHVEKWYMIEKFGQCSENIAFFAMNSIRYRKSYNIHRIPMHVNEWPRNNEIWNNNDLVLTHRWKPSPADLALANKRGEQLAKKGDWELWRTR
jgi:hypothetical protein